MQFPGVRSSATDGVQEAVTRSSGGFGNGGVAFLDGYLFR